MSKDITSFFSKSIKEEKTTTITTTIQQEQQTDDSNKPTAKKRKSTLDDQTDQDQQNIPVEHVIPPAKKARAEANKAAAMAKLEAKKKATSESKQSASTESKSSSMDWDHLENSIHPSWQKHLAGEFKKPYWSTLKQKLKKEVDSGVEVFPPFHLIFRALQLCPFDEVKAVIIGQDPYHDNGQAEGLCFSVPKGKAVPSSLRNIYKELADDIKGFKIPKHGHLLKWAEQGVLLLNITLTVQAHKANSHKSFGWSEFTSAVVNALNKDRTGLVFLLWGADAQKKASSIDKKKHHLLTAAHPSGLSANRGFYGCKHFSKCNDLLQKQGIQPIDWSLD